MTTRTTVYFEPQLHKALKIKAAQTGQTISDILNTLLKQDLGEDQADLVSFAERENETAVGYEDFLARLKADGTL